MPFNLVELSNHKMAMWNSNEWASIYEATGKDRKTAGAHDGLVAYVKKQLDVEILVGGYMEDRSFSLRGTYLEPDNFLHLGIDIFGLEANDCVITPCVGEVVQIWNDRPEPHGWGTRVLIDAGNDTYLCYGHLSTETMSYLKLGTKVKRNTIIGGLGSPEENGGWAPHVHFQVIKGNIDEYLNNPASLDGYGKLSEKAQLMKRFPDPQEFLRKCHQQ